MCKSVGNSIGAHINYIVLVGEGRSLIRAAFLFVHKSNISPDKKYFYFFISDIKFYHIFDIK